MADLSWLQAIRYGELEAFVHMIGKRHRVLEIGGGPGHQNRLLRRRGVSIVSVDVAGSYYRRDRVAEIVEYDGRTLPFADQTFDRVLTSHVLEHVVSLSRLHDEMARVLRPGGSAVHVVPTWQWLLATWAVHYPLMARKVVEPLASTLRQRGSAPAERDDEAQAPEEDMAQLQRRLPRQGTLPRPEDLPEVGPSKLLRMLRSGLAPRRHGERGNVVTELLYFRPAWWRRHFRQQGWAILEDYPIPLAYTGHLRTSLGLSARRTLSSALGPSSHVFRVSPP